MDANAFRTNGAFCQKQMYAACAQILRLFV
jgi:hypothetical protein